jgi:hypothetical protein
VLPGLTSSRSERRTVEKQLSGRGYDVFVPNYLARESVASSAEAIREFFETSGVAEYRKVHIYAYIAGGRALNLYLREHAIPNLATIVYDRSPLQERAPAVVVSNLGWAVRVGRGRVVQDIAQSEYEPVPADGRSIGIIVEGRATPYMRWHKEETLRMGPLAWEPSAFNQDHDDILYTTLNHNQMYGKLAVYRDELLHFIGHGAFTSEARRHPWDHDPFAAREPQPEN